MYRIYLIASARLAKLNTIDLYIMQAKIVPTLPHPFVVALEFSDILNSEIL